MVVVQGLFVKYLDKAQKLHQRGVFSCPANLSRLKTQLALEANKSLNVLSLRRNIAADIKHPIDTSTVSSKFSLGRIQHIPPPKPYRPLATRQGEDKKGKVYLTRVEKQQQWMDRELSDLQRQMPHLQSSLFQNIGSQNLPLQKRSMSDSVSISEENLSGERSDDAVLNSMRQKFSSLPELFSRDAVLEELGVLPEDIKDYVLKRSQSESKIVVCTKNCRVLLKAHLIKGESWDAALSPALRGDPFMKFVATLWALDLSVAFWCLNFKTINISISRSRHWKLRAVFGSCYYRETSLLVSRLG